VTPPPATYPIDLPTALQLADAHNLQIQFARERINAAVAQQDHARVLWLPDISVGPRWNRHDGQLQDTRGEVFSVSKSSLYAGGGPVMQFGLAEAHFAPLAARQLVAARQAGARGVANATQLDVALTYWDLVRAYSAQAIVQQTIDHSRQLDELSQAYLRAEKLKEADSERVRAELHGRMQELDVNREQVRVVSARLAQALRLDPFVTLQPAEQQAMPVDLLESDAADGELVSVALSNRPELAENRALVQAAMEKVRQAKYSPLLPSILLGYGAGGFGGGPNDFFGDFGGRSDFEAAAVWEIRNLGAGNRASVRERCSDMRQAEIRVVAEMDRIAAEVADAVARVRSRKAQMESARLAVESATRSYELNLKLFKVGGIEQIRPLEVLQSVQALARAQQDYLGAVIEYNRAQFQLHWATGYAVNAAGVATSSSQPDATTGQQGS
jgi:outer membrane protein TolC